MALILKQITLTSQIGLYNKANGFVHGQFTMLTGLSLYLYRIMISKVCHTHD